MRSQHSFRWLIMATQIAAAYDGARLSSNVDRLGGEYFPFKALMKSRKCLFCRTQGGMPQQMMNLTSAWSTFSLIAFFPSVWYISAKFWLGWITCFNLDALLLSSVRNGSVFEHFKGGTGVASPGVWGELEIERSSCVRFFVIPTFLFRCSMMLQLRLIQSLQTWSVTVVGLVSNLFGLFRP